MKYLESRKFSKYDSSKNVSALQTGFAISWNSTASCCRCGFVGRCRPSVGLCSRAYPQPAAALLPCSACCPRPAPLPPRRASTHQRGGPQETPLEAALAALAPDAAAAAAALLRAEGVTTAQLRSGAVTDADLEEAGLAADARAAIAAWRTAP